MMRRKLAVYKVALECLSLGCCPMTPGTHTVEHTPSGMAQQVSRWFGALLLASCMCFTLRANSPAPCLSFLQACPTYADQKLSKWVRLMVTSAVAGHVWQADHIIPVFQVNGAPPSRLLLL